MVRLPESGIQRSIFPPDPRHLTARTTALKRNHGQREEFFLVENFSPSTTFHGEKRGPETRPLRRLLRLGLLERLLHNKCSKPLDIV